MTVPQSHSHGEIFVKLKTLLTASTGNGGTRLYIPPRPSELVAQSQPSSSVPPDQCSSVVALPANQLRVVLEEPTIPFSQPPSVKPQLASVKLAITRETEPQTAPKPVTAPQTTTELDDNTLIRNYVNGFTAGNSVIISNSKLRTEKSFGTVQLLSWREGIISTAKIANPCISATVKRSSTYWALVHQALIEKCFFPLPESKLQPLYNYKPRKIPEGYDIHCTTAKELWRNCWGNGGRSSRYGIPLDMLIFSRGSIGRKETWYPVKGLDCRNGKLLVRFLGGEEAYNIDDMVVWLKKNNSNSLYDTARRRGVRPDLRPFLRN